jgi:hypothetical protein
MLPRKTPMSIQYPDFPADSIAAAQREMRLSYYGGALGVLTSAMMWLAAGVAAVAVSPQKAIWTLFIGGMFIHPLAQVWNRAIGRPARHALGNPFGALAASNTFWMILMMPLAYGASRLRIEWFFPAMLLIIGGRYTTAAIMFGDRTYWAFGVALALAGCVLALANASPSLGAFTGAAIEAVFGAAIFAMARVEGAAVPPSLNTV